MKAAERLVLVSVHSFWAVAAVVLAGLTGSAAVAAAQEVEAVEPKPERRVVRPVPGPGARGLQPIDEREIRALKERSRGPVSESAAGIRLKPGVTAPAPPTGPVYTWRDGDRTLRARLQSDLAVTREGAIAPGSEREIVARTGRGVIVSSAAAASVDAQPVFRADSGALMTLPGGVLVIFDAGLDRAAGEAILAANGIGLGVVSPLGSLPNGVFVETEPGFPSLELANELAGLEGIRSSSPNWWRERAKR